jgi:putative spermidine/putrescine transport system permease protein
MAFQPYTTAPEKIWHYALRAICAAIVIFLLAPLLVVIPLSFNNGTFLTFPLAGFSTRWYAELFQSANWTTATWNSFLIGSGATVLATALGTVAAIGLKQMRSRASRIATAIILSPMIVPVVITGVGVYFLYSPLGLVSSILGMILAHTVLSVPFVVITVTAALNGFDTVLLRAAASCGASPFHTFRKVLLPLILPGVMSGAVFAFAISFDDIVLALFLAGPEQRTLPIQMFNGVREEINPTITAAATLLVLLSICCLAIVEGLRRRGLRLSSAAVRPEV